MRLIGTSSLTLIDHPDSNLPESGYAILSHRWLSASEEVTFGDLDLNQDVSYKVGFAKLKNFRSIAFSKGYEYAWIDTCCIDKRSAVELGSAINSMYRWYKNAGVCIAYLHDVSEDQSLFTESEWFQRGWTLQELIAPSHLEFYDRTWRSIGTKNENVSLRTARTGIPDLVLKDASKLKSCSIAQRMSWAAERTTERIEDRAYSLLGLFDVNIEMIYGEQEKAFLRLQEKIIQYSSDQSIFVWDMDAGEDNTDLSGLFATSPSAFRNCGDVVKGNESRSFSHTNLGLVISLLCVPYDIETYMGFLDCSRASIPASLCGILVCRLKGYGQWARISGKDGNVFNWQHDLLNTLGAIRRDVCVRQIPTSTPISACQAYGVWLRELTPPHFEPVCVQTITRKGLSSDDHALLSPGTFGTVAVVSIKPAIRLKWLRGLWIKVGFDNEFQPVIMIANSSDPAIDLQDEKYFNIAEAPRLTSQAHGRLFDNQWLRPEKLNDYEQLISIQSGWPRGAKVVVHKKSKWPDQAYEFQL